MDKFTDEKYNIGINQEFCFISLMKMNNILLHHMNLKNKSCSVDFRIPNTDVYIELKYRQISSTKYNNSLFDKKKVDIWNKSKIYSKACIFICFKYIDDELYFIKYNKDLFDNFDTKYIEKWGSTNYLIPLDNCLDLDEFIDVLNQLKPCY